MNQPTRLRFSPGEIVATRGADALLREQNLHPVRLLARHLAGDWGDLDVDDRRANDHAARTRDGRLLSRYDVPAWLAAEADDALWIITDDLADPDSATTL